MDLPMVFEIRLKGLLNDNWSDWVCPGGNHDSFRMTHTEQGETLIRGELRDQCTLQAVMTRLGDLGLTLNLVVAARKKTAAETQSFTVTPIEERL